jgi:hypothetical protein
MAGAQSATNYWLNPAGGDWNDPANWILGQVPDAFTPGYFILPASYTVFSASTLVEAIYVEDGAIDFFTPASADFTVNYALDITGNSSSGRGAAFRIRGEGDAFLGNLLLGQGRLGSTFAVGSGRTVDILSLVATEFSTVRFEVDETSANTGRMISVGSDTSLEAGFKVTGSGQAFMLPGQSLELVDSRDSSGPILLPEFGIVRPPPGTDLFVRIEQRVDGMPVALIAEAEVADSVTSAESGFGYPLDEPPLELLSIDYDTDGDDDLIAIVSGGKHAVFELTPAGYSWLEYLESESEVRAATTGDFDDDGLEDVAIASEIDIDGDGLTDSFLQLFLAADSFSAGPSTTTNDIPVSLAAIRIPTSKFFTGGAGVALSTREASSGRGTTKSYETSDTDVDKTGEVEVGDDPGPSDPIDDEQKKDPDAPIGVGAEATAFANEPVFLVLQPVASGLDIERTIPVSGRVVDFDSGDIDGDGEIETLVLTSANRIDLLRPLRSSDVYGSIPIEPGAIALSIANLDDDARFEALVAFDRGDGTGFLRLHRIDSILAPDSTTGSSIRPYLSERLEIPLGSLDLAAASASSNSNGLIATAGVIPSGLPVLLTYQVERVEFTDCGPFDINGDGLINAVDVGQIMADWGPCAISCPADLNGDGVVGSADLGILFSNWGPC